MSTLRTTTPRMTASDPFSSPIGIPSPAICVRAAASSFIRRYGACGRCGTPRVGRMSAPGQNAKYSLRADVFRFASASRTSTARTRVRPNHSRQSPSVRPMRWDACSSGKRGLTLDHHVRDQGTLGPDPCRLCDRARYDVGGHAVGGLEAGLPTSAWTSMVRVDIGSSDLSSTVVLLVVVRL